MKKAFSDKIPYEKMSECFATALSYFLKFRPFPNMTQTMLAKKVGISQGYITKLANRKLAGAEEVRRKIAAVYGFDGSESDRTYDDFLHIGYTILTQKVPKNGHAKNGDNMEVGKMDDSLTVKLRNAHIKLLITESKVLMEQFQDKETAYGINRLLLEIENNDSKRFLEIYEHVKLIHAFSQNKKND